LYFDPVAGRAEPASGARKEAQPTPRDKNQILSPQPNSKATLFIITTTVQAQNLKGERASGKAGQSVQCTD
jgi:hypothetical protein